MNLLNQFSPPKYWRVIAILVLSLALRLALIFQGGQYYFPDEIRYLHSKDIATSVLQGDFEKAFFDATYGSAHLGYRITAVIPALLENYFHLTPATPAIFFSLFSVLNLYLIWKIAQHVGIPERESYFALLIATSSHSLMYFSRHLLPYDLALFFGLLSLYVGLSDTLSNKMSFASGCLGFLCFITYNGYWPLASFAVSFPVLISINDKLQFFRKALLSFTGVVFPLAILTILTSIGADMSLIRDYAGFAQSVTQGSFGEGWSMPFEYLWQAEHTVLIFLVISCLYAALNTSRENIKTLAVGAGGTLFIYLCLSIPSTALQKFVVYGRLSRQLVPFLTLASAHGLSILSKRGKFSKQTAMAIILILCTQATINYRLSHEIVYPRKFIQIAQEQYPTFRMSIKRTNTGAPPICKHKNYVAVNIKYLYPALKYVPSIPEDSLISLSHPINFLPYQYEGYTPEERQIFRDENIKMELLLVDEDSEAFANIENLKNCVAAKP